MHFAALRSFIGFDATLADPRGEGFEDGVEVVAAGPDLVSSVLLEQAERRFLQKDRAAEKMKLAGRAQVLLLRLDLGQVVSEHAYQLPRSLLLQVGVDRADSCHFFVLKLP